MGVASEDMTAVGTELRILLVAADDDTRSLLELALSARGHAVTTGVAASDALRAIDATAFQMIVIDRNLPDLNVAELCRRLRDEPNGRESTIIVLSESCEALDRSEAIEAGANDCLSWPDDAMLLRTHLESVERAARAPRFPEIAERFGDVVGDGEAAIVLGRDGTIRDIGSAIEEWLGYTSGELVGVSAFTLFHLDDAPELLSLSTQAMGMDRPTEAVFARLRAGSDAWRRLRLRALSRLADPDVGGIVLLVSRTENDAHAPASDPLRDVTTGLPSNALFMDRLDHALQLAQRRDESVIVMVIDVESSGDLDALYGVGAIEQTARQIAARVQSSLRTGDTTGRLRVDEFGAIVEGLNSADESLAVARRIVRDLSAPFTVAEAPLELTPCVGIALSWDGRGSADEVLRQARLAHRSAAANPLSDGHYALIELGKPPVIALVEPRETALVLAEDAEHVAARDDSLWFSPLMDRIGALEREIGRIHERRAAAQALSAD